MTKSEKNLKEIMQNMPQDTAEIQHIVLKSQFGNKRKRMM